MLDRAKTIYGNFHPTWDSIQRVHDTSRAHAGIAQEDSTSNLTDSECGLVDSRWLHPDTGYKHH